MNSVLSKNCFAKTEPFFFKQQQEKKKTIVENR